MTPSPPRSLATTGAPNPDWLSTIRCRFKCDIDMFFFKSSSGLTLLRTAWLVCFFVISNPAQRCSANTPPNPRRVDKAGVLGKKLTFYEATRLICTPLQLVVARQLEYDISPWGVLVHKQPSYRLLSPSSELSAASGAEERTPK